jgi:hypothetical protein
VSRRIVRYERSTLIRKEVLINLHKLDRAAHYHFRHSADEVLVCPNGAPRSSAQRGALLPVRRRRRGLLDAQTLSVETWARDPENARQLQRTPHETAARAEEAGRREIVGTPSPTPRSTRLAFCRPLLDCRHDQFLRHGGDLCGDARPGRTAARRHRSASSTLRSSYRMR